jgi:hypothetical protein
MRYFLVNPSITGTILAYHGRGCRNAWRDATVRGSTSGKSNLHRSTIPAADNSKFRV